jgi:hypothetical protein
VKTYRVPVEFEAKSDAMAQVTAARIAEIVAKVRGKAEPVYVATEDLAVRVTYWSVVGVRPSNDRRDAPAVDDAEVPARADT